MSDLDVYEKMSQIEAPTLFPAILAEDTEHARKLAQHIIWLQNIRKERPNPEKHFKVGIYIRYFNQTKYDNYLEHHKKQFLDTMALCPNWEFVGFYIDAGSGTPNMESSPEWGHLLDDCMEGKVDLIITQKVSNVSKKSNEMAICARLLAAQDPPIGIYFISEDIFTLASYYQDDLHDVEFLLEAPELPLLEESTEGKLYD